MIMPTLVRVRNNSSSSSMATAGGEYCRSLRRHSMMGGDLRCRDRRCEEAVAQGHPVSAARLCSCLRTEAYSLNPSDHCGSVATQVTVQVLLAPELHRLPHRWAGDHRLVVRRNARSGPYHAVYLGRKRRRGQPGRSVAPGKGRVTVHRPDCFTSRRWRRGSQGQPAIPLNPGTYASPLNRGGIGRAMCARARSRPLVVAGRLASMAYCLRRYTAC